MKLSVVIPALDEAERIEATILGALDSPAPTAPSTGSAIEVLVVDGGSQDQTRHLAEAAGARVLESAPGRARQLAAGAEASGGEAILFLHADTRLPRGWSAAVRRALGDPAVAGGAFHLEFDERSPTMRWIEGFVRVRIALWGLPYGDQAIFLRRRVLDAIGGVPQVPLMEDLDLVSRLKEHGRLVMLRERVTTSARRYREQGVVRTLIRHWVALSAWRLDIDRARLADWMGR
ncbi:MAG: TIGR04283 family arsenosugar biosynthesis glycosyltransferase [Myxococcota bacterium]